MTERLYYTDAYTTQFEARIVDRLAQPQSQRVGLILDHTYFYPTSGGQPHDTGRIHTQPVVDVTIREADEAVVHIIEGEIWQETIQAEVNWSRRFDHMQQHSGQHILSRAFLNYAAADTVGFHLGADTATIDLDRPDMSAAQIEQAEWQANQVVWENRPVRVMMVSPAEAKELALRKLPPDLTGRVRLIDIEQFDLTACGGTHVSHTGEVGIIKIVALEKRRQLLRVHFRCGQRALTDYRAKNRILNQLSTAFTTSYEALEHVTGRLREDHKQAQRQIRDLRNQLRHYRVEEILAATKPFRGVRIVRMVLVEEDVAEVRALAHDLTNRPGVIALIGLVGSRSLLVFSRSANASGDMSKLIKPALQLLGTTAGGGTAELAQGGGPPADEERVKQALAHAERLIRGQLK